MLVLPVYPPLNGVIWRVHVEPQHILDQIRHGSNPAPTHELFHSMTRGRIRSQILGKGVPAFICLEDRGEVFLGEIARQLPTAADPQAFLDDALHWWAHGYSQVLATLPIAPAIGGKARDAAVPVKGFRICEFPNQPFNPLFTRNLGN